MAYTYKKNLAKRTNYGSKRDVTTIKYIVIHYTANDGDTDENNGKYFASGNRNASAHYFVDDDSVTQSVPDNFVAWSVGGAKWNDCAKTGGGKLYGKATNSNTLNIEICDDVKNGKIYPSAKTIENVIILTKAKMKEYKIPADRVIRHFDVNGKHCPAYWMDEAKWKAEFHDKLTEVPKFEPYKVTTTVSSLNVRKGAGTSYKVCGVITDNDKLVKSNPNYYFPKTVYTIVEEKKNGLTKWGKLKSGAGWISLGYAKRV